MKDKLQNILKTTEYKIRQHGEVKRLLSKMIIIHRGGQWGLVKGGMHWRCFHLKYQIQNTTDTMPNTTDNNTKYNRHNTKYYRQNTNTSDRQECILPPPPLLHYHLPPIYSWIKQMLLEK